MNFAYYVEVFRPAATSRYIISALERQGHTVHIIARQPDCFGEQKFPLENISRAIDIYRDNVLLLSCAPCAKPEDLKAIKRRFPKLKIAWWVFDLMSRPPSWKAYAPLARVSDICFQTDGSTGGASDYRNIRRYVLKQGIDKDLHRPPSHVTAEDVETYSADVAFFGTAYEPGGRADLIQWLGQWCKKRRLVFRHWCTASRPVYNRELAKAVYLSKLTVGSTWDATAENYWSNRVYLMTGCQSCFLNQYSPGIEREFTDGEHLVNWRTREELEAHMIRLLADDDERNRIALNGRTHTATHYTYDHRVMELAAVLETL